MTDETNLNEESARANNADRRSVVKATLLAGAASVIGFGAGNASASSSPSGEIGTDTAPFETAYLSSMTFVGRDSDPSDPDDGMLWYNEDP